MMLLMVIGLQTFDNVENYMEYSYCNKMFTNGQKNRMRAAFKVVLEVEVMLYLHQIKLLQA
jgi:hypothetical protein